MYWQTVPYCCAANDVANWTAERIAQNGLESDADYSSNLRHFSKLVGYIRLLAQSPHTTVRCMPHSSALSLWPRNASSSATIAVMALQSRASDVTVILSRSEWVAERPSDQPTEAAARSVESNLFMTYWRWNETVGRHRVAVDRPAADVSHRNNFRRSCTEQRVEETHSSASSILPLTRCYHHFAISTNHQSMPFAV